MSNPSRSRLTSVAAASIAGVVAAGLLISAGLDDGAAGAARRSTSSIGSAGIGDPYWPLDGNGGIDVRHYDIHDTYGFDDGRLTGTTVITLTAKKRLRSFHLDFLLPVSAVTVDGVPAAHHELSGHELAIEPAAPIGQGATIRVRVTYAGQPGSYSYAGESNWLASEKEVVAMNEPHMAPWWFPANDHPRDKATYDIAITGPAADQVVSNGLPVGRTSSSDATATTTWRSRYPMASYLAFFALGRYEIVHGRSDGLPWYVAISKEMSSAAQHTAMRVLAKTPTVTQWLADRLGRYPFESTGGLTTSLPVGFALENQTRPTYPSTFGSSAAVIVHELAHQWFGDSVSVRRWRDIWLNEGFAAYLEVAYAEAHGGQSGAAWLQETFDDRKGDADFWRLDIADPGAAHVFDGPVYDRGSMALQALRNRIGGRDFWKTLRTWAAGHRYRNGSVPQFEALAHRISGAHLGAFFHAWLEDERVPADTPANGLG